MSESVFKELSTADLRIRNANVALRVWERLFSDEDRQQLGGNLDEIWRRLGTVGMWVEARGVSVEKAVIDIAEAVNLMDTGTAHWLRRELGLIEVTDAQSTNQPHWDADTGRLSFNGIIVRRVRVFQNPSNVQTILDEFEAAGWPTRIDNPLEEDQEKVHQALRSLNNNLAAIRFHAHEGARAIVWERA
jgi:hypothetical protein